MPTMNAMVVNKPGADFVMVEREIPTPGPGHVLIKVEACGICHSDVFVKEGLFPGIEFPRSPGHEVAGVVESVGAGVKMWQPGQRVGVGWHGGHCFECESCRRGDFITCANEAITGISYDGGYAEYMVAPEHVLALIPDGLSAVDAAPLLCAGVTTYNALRNAGARPGDVVAVQGVGGLGHLGVQYASKMGFHTVAISRGADKADLAYQLGAHVYIDAKATDAAEELAKMGGAKIILATAPNSEAMSSVINGLGVDGKLVVVGATPDPILVSPFQLIGQRKSVTGWPSGTARDSQDTMAFSAITHTKPMIETYPLAQANEAYARMMSNQARFRVVLTVN